MLNLSSLSTQSLASCVNYFVWNCLTCFSNTKIGSVTSFSILFNFQGPVRRSLSGWRLDYFTTEAVFCQALFSRLLNILNLDHSQHLSVNWCFWTSIGSFQRLRAEVSEVILCLSAWRSSIIPYAGPLCKPFLQVFCSFFAFVYIRQFFTWNQSLLWHPFSTPAMCCPSQWEGALHYI